MHSISYSTLVLILALWYSTNTAANPSIFARQASCAASETNQLKCLGTTQFYICPAPGQAPIVQAVAAGTECKNNALNAIGAPAPAPPPPAAGSPKPEPPPPTTSAAAPPPAPPKPTSEPAPAPPPPAASSAKPKPTLEPLPKGAPNPCRYGGVPTGQVFDCKTQANANNDYAGTYLGVGLAWFRKMYCIDTKFYTICEQAPTTICSLLGVEGKMCHDNKVVDDTIGVYQGIATDHKWEPETQGCGVLNDWKKCPSTVTYT